MQSTGNALEGTCRTCSALRSLNSRQPSTVKRWNFQGEEEEEEEVVQKKLKSRVETKNKSQINLFKSDSVEQKTFN